MLNKSEKSFSAQPGLLLIVTFDQITYRSTPCTLLLAEYSVHKLFVLSLSSHPFSSHSLQRSAFTPLV